MDAEFAPAGTEEFGSNINFLYTCAVRQKARYLRLKMTPAGEEGVIYLAEVEFFGSEPDRRSEITALASGRLGPAGVPPQWPRRQPGEIVAVDAEGKRLWTYQARGASMPWPLPTWMATARQVIAGGSRLALRLDATGSAAGSIDLGVSRASRAM